MINPYNVHNNEFIPDGSVYFNDEPWDFRGSMDSASSNVRMNAILLLRVISAAHNEFDRINTSPK
jgi:hypothetical protein